MRLLPAILILACLLPTALARTDGEYTYTPTSDQICTNGVCEFLFYGYEANFFDPVTDSWEKINESFYDCGGAYCTNTYYFSASISKDGVIKTTIDKSYYALRLLDIGGTVPDYSMKATDNLVLFPNIYPGYMDLQYIFATDHLKEIFTIYKPPTIPKGVNELNITFENLGDPILRTTPEIICDALENCLKVEVIDNKTNTVIPVPASFLQDPKTVYPITVDPSQAFNGTPNTTFSGHVVFDGTSSYTRSSDPPQIFIGQNQSLVISNFYRAAFEFNVSTLPIGITITAVNLRFFVITTGDNSNDLLNFMAMTGDNYTYPNDNSGNQLYYNDMGNGTQINFTQIQPGQNNINLTTAGQSINNSVGGDGIFSIGVFSFFGEAGGANISGKQATGIRPRTFGTPNNRPLLNITFTLQPTVFAINLASPLNQTYTVNLTLLNVSAEPSPNSFWYSLNGGPNVTFIPNTTFVAAEGFNKLIVYANDTTGAIVSKSVSFTVRTKTFLMELFLFYETLAVLMFYIGLKHKSPIFVLVAAVMFLSWVPDLFHLEPLTSSAQQVSPYIYMNLGLGAIAMVVFLVETIEQLRVSVATK